MILPQVPLHGQCRLLRRGFRRLGRRRRLRRFGGSTGGCCRLGRCTRWSSRLRRGSRRRLGRTRRGGRCRLGRCTRWSSRLRRGSRRRRSQRYTRRSRYRSTLTRLRNFGRGAGNIRSHWRRVRPISTCPTSGTKHNRTQHHGECHNAYQSQRHLEDSCTSQGNTSTWCFGERQNQKSSRFKEPFTALRLDSHRLRCQFSFKYVKTLYNITYSLSRYNL